jgi:hypothetical protein
MVEGIKVTEACGEIIEFIFFGIRGIDNFIDK